MRLYRFRRFLSVKLWRTGRVYRTGSLCGHSIQSSDRFSQSPRWIASSHLIFCCMTWLWSAALISKRLTHRMLPVSIADQDIVQPVHAAEYLLVCTASSFSIDRGSWNFSLESVDGQSVLEAGDDDLGDLNRLTLLAAVRGLEAIDGPSGVTLLSHNRYLIRSLSDSLPRWRENNFVWEHFGRRIDVQHADLWRRVDTALSIHCVEACLVSSRRVSPMVAQQSTIVQPVLQSPNSDGTSWRIDSAHSSGAAGNPAIPAPRRTSGVRPKDSLRRWLLDSATSHATRGGGRRFTAADLAGTA